MLRLPGFRLAAVLAMLMTGMFSGVPRAATVGIVAPAAYNPLNVSNAKIETRDLVVRDESRKRDIPVLVYLPNGKEAAPVVLFSHGLGGSRNGNAFMGNHWAGRGYVVVFVQHPGSDEGVWKDIPPTERLAAMRAAASPENLLLRVKDIPAVLDQLERWNKTSGHPLAGRMKLDRVGMSGHSFGAGTTQAVGGQIFNGRLNFTEPRVAAAIAFSPSAPKRGDLKQAFGSVKIPWMLMTGTKDSSVAITGVGPESRLAVYPALPEGGKYELVLFNAEHSAFTDRALPGDREPRNPNHHKVILALGTAFWDAWLRGDADAGKWLDGDGAKSVLEPKDAWRRK